MTKDHHARMPVHDRLLRAVVVNPQTLAVITISPASGSPQGRPEATATRPTSAPADDSASSQECRASAIRVAELIRLPTISF